MSSRAAAEIPGHGAAERLCSHKLDDLGQHFLHLRRGQRADSISNDVRIRREESLGAHIAVLVQTPIREVGRGDQYRVWAPDRSTGDLAKDNVIAWEVGQHEGSARFVALRSEKGNGMTTTSPLTNAPTRRPPRAGPSPYGEPFRMRATDRGHQLAAAGQPGTIRSRARPRACRAAAGAALPRCERGWHVLPKEASCRLAGAAEAPAPLIRPYCSSFLLAVSRRPRLHLRGAARFPLVAQDAHRDHVHVLAVAILRLPLAPLMDEADRLI